MAIEFEIMLAFEILNHKFPVEAITPDGRDHVGSNGMIFKAAGLLSSINSDEYKVVGAICAGPIGT